MGACADDRHGLYRTWTLPPLYQVKRPHHRGDPPECQQELDPLSSHQRREGESDSPTAADGHTDLWNTTLEQSKEEDEAKALGPFTTLSTEPLTWAISCILPFSTDQHYTPHAELSHFTVLFTRACLFRLPSTFFFFFFFSGAIYQQYQPSGLIKVLLIQLQAWISWSLERSKRRRLWPSEA